MLDSNVTKRLDHLIDRWHELKRMGVQRIGLDEMSHFYIKEIEKLCEEHDLDNNIYLKLYDDGVEMEQSKKDIKEKIGELEELLKKEGVKCILKIRLESGEVTPFYVAEKCEKCEGYSSNILCSDYVDANHLITYYKRFL